MMLECLPDGPLDLAQRLLLRRGRRGKRAADRSDHEAMRAFGERKSACFAADADDPAGSAREAAQVLGLAAVGAGGELGRKAGGEGELEAEGERGLEARRLRLVGVVEQGQVTT